MKKALNHYTLILWAGKKRLLISTLILYLVGLYLSILVFFASANLNDFVLIWIKTLCYHSEHVGNFEFISSSRKQKAHLAFICSHLMDVSPVLIPFLALFWSPQAPEGTLKAPLCSSASCCLSASWQWACGLEWIYQTISDLNTYLMKSEESTENKPKIVWNMLKCVYNCSAADTFHLLLLLLLLLLHYQIGKVCLDNTFT